MAQDAAEKIRASIEQFVAEDPRNSMAAHGGMRIFDSPLVGVAAADDPMFLRLKQPMVIGPHHLTPLEWLPGAGSVVSYFLPFTLAVRSSNRALGGPSQEWLSARIDGEAFNNRLREHLVATLKAIGGDAIAPDQDKAFKIVDRRSNWSQRHVAFVAGLGTFGLSRSLITRIGCAGRYGSAVTTLSIPPTPRTATSVSAACPWLMKGECGECIDRCPVGAISEAGKDTKICSDYLETIRAKYAPRYGCAKCQNGVPCEFTSPS